jgi:uncharacterized phage protein (TIGR02220 family)
MARPTKQGIDYFPLDVQLDPDLELFISECGMAGFGILISVWQFIYQFEGYYAKYDDKFPLHIRRRTLAEKEEIDAAISSAIDLDIFDKEKFEKHKILTSRGIQRRYFIAAKQKKIVSIDENYICHGVSTPDNVVCIRGNATKEEVEVKEEVKSNVVIILDHLNSVVGSQFRPTTAKTKQVINARISDGFTVENITTVIDKKADQWQGTEYEKFLRPETLFGTKFESYLNERSTKKQPAVFRQPLEGSM